jgi:hypothetical protein
MGSDIDVRERTDGDQHDDAAHQGLPARRKISMATKRDRFVVHVRELAKQRGKRFRLKKWRGKGGHALLWVGDKVTTLPSREIDPKTAKKILKALDLDDGWRRSMEVRLRFEER